MTKQKKKSTFNRYISTSKHSNIKLSHLSAEDLADKYGRFKLARMHFIIHLLLLLTEMSMGSAEGKEVKFEEVLSGLKNNSLIYLDVRNVDELRTDGKVAGSVVVPCKYFLNAHLNSRNTLFYLFLVL